MHGLLPNLTREQKSKFVEFYRHLSRLGLNHSTSSAAVLDLDKPMPDLVPKGDKLEMYEACRRECAFNFPALVLVVGPENFADVLYPTFSDLACDSCPAVRRTLASSLHEIAKLVGTDFAMTKVQVSNLFANTGHGSKGWTYSWGSAVLLAKVETKQYCSQMKIFCADCVQGKYRKYQPGEL